MTYIDFKDVSPEVFTSCVLLTPPASPRPPRPPPSPSYVFNFLDPVDLCFWQENPDEKLKKLGTKRGQIL